MLVVQKKSKKMLFRFLVGSKLERGREKSEEKKNRTPFSFEWFVRPSAIKSIDEQIKGRSAHQQQQ